MTRSYCYDHPRPAVTVDTAAFALDRSTLRVLMIRRGRPPFEGSWALPGGFLDPEEDAEPAARRELREETGVEVPPGLPFEPIGFYAAPGRDPRGRTISLAFAAVLPPPPPEPSGGDDAAEAAWVAAEGPDRPLAFDHGAILGDALAWLRAGVEAGPLGLALLPDPFERDDARAMFHAVGLPLRHSARWLGRCAKEAWIEPIEGQPQRYRNRRGAGPGRAPCPDLTGGPPA